MTWYVATWSLGGDFMSPFMQKTEFDLLSSEPVLFLSLLSLLFIQSEWSLG